MVKNIQSLFLLTSVFVTGTAVLIIEIVAMRILSPYYGNTIYTTSSVIVVILSALSLGYYFGGKLADKYPYDNIFYAIIFVSGFATLIMQVFSNLILQFFSMMFSMTAGPLVSSLFLFFIPAFLLGTLSPVAIKLHQKPDGKLGQQAGEVFFWSTLGSINGTILSGFFLIPFLGINIIVIATGIVLSFWGLIGFLLLKTNKRIGLMMIFALLLGLLLLYIGASKREANLVYEKDGLYEKIKVVDGIWNDKPTRFLFQDRSYSAAMHLDSDELVYDYTKYYALYKLINPEAKNTFLIGGGAYSIPKSLLHDSKTMQVDVAEIEPALYENAKTYFNLPDSKRLHNYIEDGRRFLAKTNKKYDVIISDAYYSLFSIPVHLTTKEFFTLAKNRLNNDGVFIGNFVGYIDQKDPSLILSEIKTFRGVFENSYFFAVNSPTETASQNIIFLGINGAKKIDFESDMILKNNNPILSNLWQKNINIDAIDFKRQKELTDNFAPVEYLVSKIITR